MKILIAIDGSPSSQSTMSLVKALIPTSRSEITILTVIPERVFLGSHTLATIIRRSNAPKTIARQAEEDKALNLLEEFRASLNIRRAKAEISIARGDPAEEIIKTCRRINANLVVIGAKGASNIPEFMLGGVAQKVIRYAPCSVLVAKRDVKSVKRVLVPVDGSKASNETILFLKQLPLHHRTQVLLMTVAESFAEWLAEAPTLSVDTNSEIITELQKAEEGAAKKLIAAAKKDLQTAGYKISAMIAQGDPASQILNTAKQEEADLIALGAKGLTGIRSFLIGSVAQRISRYSEASILLVRPPKGK